MNKLMGFYELKDINIPSVPWKKYSTDAVLSPDILWTIRTAVYRGNDLNLPRKVGIDAKSAKIFADKMLRELEGKGMVVYYPYFIANKSGTLDVFSDRIVIESVKKDLWNLVTYSDREVTIIIDSEGKKKIGNKDFLKDAEIENIEKYVATIRRSFKDVLLEGKSVLLEWSFANKCDINMHPIDEEFLVFYEIRTL